MGNDTDDAVEFDFVEDKGCDESGTITKEVKAAISAAMEELPIEVSASFGSVITNSSF
jgi:hypothetical protein